MLLAFETIFHKRLLLSLGSFLKVELVLMFYIFS